jgi:N-methylhydantoinase A
VSSALRVAVDIGGTFTDLVATDPESGWMVEEKTLTTPADLSDGIFTVLDRAAVKPDRISMLIHGSTVAINAYLERTGAATALLTTKGFRDSYEMGRKTRPDMYNLFFEPRQYLVPRSRRYEVDERIDADGNVLVAADEEEIRALIRGVPASVESIAVCLLNSYATPRHEELVGRLVGEERPDVYVSISTDVSREIREYERTSTAVMNAYVGPRVSRYLTTLERRLQQGGFAGEALLTQSNGGMMSLATARRQAVRMMESGPAAGVIAAAHVCRRLGIENAIAFDMGGTTAKACVIENGEPEMAAEYYVGGAMTGLPVQVPFLQIVEVGAGGGSIAHLDPAGGLRIGPQSAGSDPGPACYGLGGTEPTITDANLLAGRIDAERFLGGAMPLDRELAERAVGELADSLGIDVERAADGVIRLANSIMAHAIRAVTVERGRDPRDYVLVAYGGGGPLHAGDLAAELDIPRIVIPVGAPTFAAFGMLVADLRHDVSASLVRRLDAVEQGDLDELFGVLREQATELLRRAEDDEGEIEFSYRAELRYIGQFHTLNLALDGPRLPAAEVAADFHRQHEHRYGHAAEGAPIEVNALRVAAIRRIETPAPRSLGGEDRPAAVPRGRRSVLLADGEAIECDVWSRADLSPLTPVTGPAVIEEATTAVNLRPGDVAQLTEQGHLKIERGAAS